MNKEKFYFSTRDLMIMAALSAAGGVISTYINFIGDFSGLLCSQSDGVENYSQYTSAAVNPCLQLTRLCHAGTRT